MQYKNNGARAPALGGVRRRSALTWGMFTLAGASFKSQATQGERPRLPQGEWASDWASQLDPSLYLVSEKLDGVRAIWDGAALRFRSGRPIAAPAWFADSLPREALDGELWMGRSTFDRLSGTVRKVQPIDADWRSLRYMLFDAPVAGVPFSERAQRLQSLVQRTDVPWLGAIEQSQLASAAGLQTRLQQVAALGGEGLVMHRLDALWQPGRSDAVRKLKLQPDDEATVVAHVPGKGKFEGQMGALLLEMQDGKRFALGSGFNAADRAHPPAIGAQVTYRYRDHTPAGLPKFASFLRVRPAE